MTIRSGGRPRDSRATQARPYDPDAYATETIPRVLRAGPVAGAADGRGGGPAGGLIGLLKFLVFALVLAAVVLRGRPDRPPAARRQRDPGWSRRTTPRRSAAVREGRRRGGPRRRADRRRPRPTRPRSSSSSRRATRRATIATRLEEQGLIARRAGRSCSSRSSASLTGDAPAGHLRPAQEHDPRPARHARCSRRRRSRTSTSGCGRACASSRSRPSSRPCRSRWTPGRSTTSSRRRRRSSSTTTRGSRRSWRTPRRARRSRASCGRRRYRVLPDTTPEELVRLMLDKFIANVGASRLAVAEGPRPDVLPGAALASIVEREAVARRRAAAHRRRLPEPDRRDPRHQEQDPQRRPDGHLRQRHDRARQARRSTTGSSYAFWAPPRRPARRTSTLPEELAGYQTYQSPGLIPGPDRDADACLDRRRPRARHRGQVPLLPGDPRRRRRARVREDRGGARREPQEVRLHQVTAGWPEPADFAARADASGTLAGWDGGRPGRPARPAGRVCGRASRRPGSTPTSASGASTCAT